MARLKFAGVMSLAAGATSQDFSISNVFGSHMVIQRNSPIQFWGWAPVDSSIQCQFGSDSTLGTADNNGLWRCNFDARSTSTLRADGSFTPSTFSATVSTTKQTQTLTDILIGDVYVCSGQSNMEYTVNAVNNSAYEVQDANNYGNIRITSGELNAFANDALAGRTGRGQHSTEAA